MRRKSVVKRVAREVNISVKLMVIIIAFCFESTLEVVAKEMF
jgi:hypothetical protein